MKRLVLIAGLAACGGDDAPVIPDADLTMPDATPRETIMSTQILAPGMFLEGIMFGGPDDQALIRLDVASPTLDWNIHGHEGGSTQTLVEQFDVMEVDHLFVPTSETSWWLLIRNGGTLDLDVQVRVELFGDMTWEWE